VPPGRPLGRSWRGLYDSALAVVWAAELGAAVKRARRGIVLWVLALLGGAVVSVLVAEGIGYCGDDRLAFKSRTRYVSVGSRRFYVDDWKGRGWRFLLWTDFDQSNAEYALLIHNLGESGSERELHRPDPPFDSPDSLPPWAMRSLPDTWSAAPGTGSTGPVSYARNIAIGWPLLAFSMDGKTSSFHGYHGGREFAAHPVRTLSVLAWRTIPLGFALDSLIWGACLAGIVGGPRLLIRARRRRRGACAGCGYDLRGLADGAACPECGAGTVAATSSS
jgi:hypothetical protein